MKKSVCDIDHGVWFVKLHVQMMNSFEVDSRKKKIFFFFFFFFPFLFGLK